MRIGQWLAKLVGPATARVRRPPEAEAEATAEAEAEAPVELPIDGTLDLHTFRPAEVKELLPAYLQACAARGIRDVRVVHGKGRGQLKRTVEALLARQPLVAEFTPPIKVRAAGARPW